MKRTHNIIYDEYQTNYFNALKNNNEKEANIYITKMYSLCIEIGKNYLRNYCRKKGITLNIDEKSHDMTVYVLEQYIKKRLNWKVDRISSYMYFAMRKILYKNKDIEMRECSWDAMMEDLGEKEEKC